MVIYIDSSFLLSIIFEEESSEVSGKIWKDYDYRVSSLLLESECLVTLRRFYRGNKNNLESNWLSLKEKKLYDLLEEVNIRIFDENIAEYIKLKEDLSACRALDAIHLATALEFKDNCGAEIKICTYDRNMIKTAKKLNFSVLPIEGTD
ncbi:MAG: type II toxin-antitoxin system VapC family toxin [Candidatus Aminicenantes bacterium]|nr:MAG: type II toxin-antitoxin system VapC family toxin [Candidatus Aminicenantes bacterium]